MFINLREIAILTRTAGTTLNKHYFALYHVLVRQGKDYITGVRKGRKESYKFEERLWPAKIFGVEEEGLLRLFEKADGSGYGLRIVEFARMVSISRARVDQLGLKHYKALRWNRDEPEKLIVPDREVTDEQMLKLFELI